MAKLQSKTTRFLAVALALIMVISVCFTGAIATTVSAAGFTDGLTSVATVANNGCWSDKRAFSSVTSIVSSGESASSNTDNDGIMYAVNGANDTNTDGQNAGFSPYVHGVSAGSLFSSVTTLQFNNFVSYADASLSSKFGYRQFRVALSARIGTYNQDWYQLTGSVPAILFDTNKGELVFIKGNYDGIASYQVMSTIVAENDALKYDNFTGKPFTLKFEPNGDDLKVTVVIDGTTELSGIITREVWNTEPELVVYGGTTSRGGPDRLPVTDTYFSIAGMSCNELGNFQKMSVEYYGFKSEPYVYTPDLSDLTHIATTTTNANVDYASLSVIQSALTGDETSTNNVDNDGILFSTVENGYNGAYSPYVHNVDAGSLFSNKTTLYFNNYNSSSTDTAGAGYREFMVILSSRITGTDKDNQAKFIMLTGGVPAIKFDTHNGRLVFIKGVNNGITAHQEMQVLAQSDYLKYANFAGKAFTVTFSPSNIGLKVTVEINGANRVSGIIKNEIWNTKPDVTEGSAYGEDRLPTTSTYFGVAGAYANLISAQHMKVTYYGFKSEPAEPSQDRDLVFATVSGNATASSYQNCSTITSLVTAGETATNNYDGDGILFSTVGQNGANNGYSPYTHGVDAGSLYKNKITLEFANYQTTSTASSGYGYRSFLVTLAKDTSDNKNYTLTSSVAGIKFDTNLGKLVFVKGVNSGLTTHVDIQDIASSDALKYDNFKNKPFTLTIEPDGTSFKVTIVIDGTTTVTGNITNQSWVQPYDTSVSSEDAIAKLPFVNTYFSIGGMGANIAGNPQPMSIEYYGFKSQPIEFSAEDTEGYSYVASLTDNCNSDVGQSKVDNLHPYKKGGVSFYNLYNNASYSPYVSNSNLGAFPGKGFKLLFKGFYSSYREPAASNTKEVLSYRKFVIVLASKSSGTDMYRFTNYNGGILFDTVDGSIDFAVAGSGNSCNQPYTIVQNIITNDVFKYDNFAGKTFSVGFSPAANDGIKVTVTVDGVEFTGTITKENFEQIPAAQRPTTETYIGIGGALSAGTGSPNNITIDYYGYKKLNPANVDVSSLTEIATAAEDLRPTELATTSFDKSLTNFDNNEGVKIQFNRFTAFIPYSYSVNLGGWPGNGYRLQFANYINESAQTSHFAYGQLVICLSGTTAGEANKIKLGVPYLQIDTVNGKVMLRRTNDDSFGTTIPEVDLKFTTLQTLISDDIFKYDNFKEKPFSITFKASTTSPGDVDVIFDIDGTIKTGTINQDIMDGFEYRPTENSFYISIGSLDNGNDDFNKFSIEFYGYEDFGVITDKVILAAQNANEVTEAIAALENSATEANAEQILATKAKYDALEESAKLSVVGLDKLETLMQQLNTLRLDKKFKPTTTYVSIDPEFPKQFGNAGARTVFSQATDYGFNAEWRGAEYELSGFKVQLNQAIYGAFPLDGLRVFVNNYDFDQDKLSDFFINFTSGDYADTWDGTENMAERIISIRMGLQNNKFQINGVGSKNLWQAGRTELLMRDNLKGKQLIFEWKKQQNGDYVCYITVGEQVLAFTIAADKIAAMADFDPENVRVVFGSTSTSNKFSMQVNGIYSDIDAKVQEVTDKLAALSGTVTSNADLAAYEAAQTAYDALTTAQKEKVLNTSKLTAARAAARKYKGINEKGFDSEGFYIPKTYDVLGDVKSNSVYSAVMESKYNGVHLDFNNGGYGLGNTLGKYILDGLTLRFDNLEYANYGGFLVNFECSASTCKIYAFDDTDRGIYLLFGVNNTVYATKSSVKYENGNGMFALFPANEKLSATNLLNKEFTISWEEVGPDALLKLTIEVDGEKFEHLFDLEYKKGLSVWDSENVEVVVQSACGLDPSIGAMPSLCHGMSIDLTGIKYKEFSNSQFAKVQEVIDLINELPDKANNDISDDIDEIWQKYQKLTFEKMRLAVTNRDKLFKVYKELFYLQAADGTMYPDLLEDEEYEEIEEDINDDDEWYEDEDYTYDDSLDNTDSDTDSDASTEQEQNKKPVRVPVERVEYVGLSGWIIAAIIAGAALVIAAVVFIIIAKKRNSKKEER